MESMQLGGKSNQTYTVLKRTGIDELDPKTPYLTFLVAPFSLSTFSLAILMQFLALPLKPLASLKISFLFIS